MSGINSHHTLKVFIDGIKWYQEFLIGFICGIKWYQGFQINFDCGIKWYQASFYIDKVKELSGYCYKIPKRLNPPLLLLLLLLLLEYSFLVYCTGLVSTHTTPPDLDTFPEKVFGTSYTFKVFYQGI